MLHGETIQSPLPFDIPWWMPDHAIFFGVLYAVLFVIMSGLGYVIIKSLSQASKDATKDATQDAPHGAKCCDMEHTSCH
ncbi:hypothetical protein [Desulfovibrio litoralis]|uniref:Uncharacterized protein n=1 Tax=Desulfovibrio litoralis DSM 11393 TaxID=1121455 RepID=A0A1M7RZT3_9BACT|nr:hypothetical protein [Desulfovibrio litoralis]SHN51837.1 hypothetical protein SAMN02745728_00387 [Desulfovibrio litoralis DSM 11393]